MGVILNSNFTQALTSNGQLLIGKAGDLPVPATLTAGSGISITNGSGSITIDNELPVPSVNGEVVIGRTGNTPVTATVTAGTGISVINGAGSITVANTVPVPSTDGNLLIGRTGNTPVLSTLTAGSGINVTNGSGTITVANTLPIPSTDGEIIVGRTGNTPITSTLTPGSGISITNGAGSITIDNVFGPYGLQGFLYVTTSGGPTNMVANFGYFSDDSPVIYNLPIAPVGSINSVIDAGGGGFVINGRIAYHGAAGNTLTTTSDNCAITLINIGFSQNFYSVLSTNGGTFILT